MIGAREAARTGLAALASATLLALSFERPAASLLALVALVPVGLAARSAPHAAALGAAAWLSAAAWVYRFAPGAVAAFAGVPLPVGVALTAALAALEAARLAAALAVFAWRGSPAAAGLALAALEALVPSPSGAVLGAPLARAAWLAPLAAMGGGPLLSAVAAAAALAVAAAARSARPRPEAVGLAVAALLAVAPRPGRAGSLRVAVAQTDVRPGEPSLPPYALAREALAAGAELLVLPEGSLEGPVAPAATALARDLRWPAALVAVGTERGADGTRTVVALVERGAVTGTSAKALPVPLVEDGALGGLARAVSPGPARGLETRAGVRLGAHVCYEILAADAVRARVAEEAPALLAVPASDGWLPEAGELHVLVARLRAAEHGAPLAFANTVGPSVVVGPGGEELARVEPGGRGIAVADAPLRSGRTGYGALGAWPIVAAAALALALAARPVRASAPS